MKFVFQYIAIDIIFMWRFKYFNFKSKFFRYVYFSGSINSQEPRSIPKLSDNNLGDSTSSLLSATSAESEQIGSERVSVNPFCIIST